MKKHLLYSACILCLLFELNGYAQTINNPNFDNWTSTSYNEPVTWANSNLGSLQKMNAITTSSVTGFSGKAVRIQTAINGPDTAFGYILYGQGGGDPINGQGGLPYSQKPSNLTGYFRYNLPGNDTAVGIVSFKRNGSVLCSNTFKIRGTGSQTVFTAFSYSLAAQSLTVNPDTVIMAFGSSNVLGNVGMQNGSYLELDQLTFTGAGITQTITNGDFENWTSNTYDKLNGWGIAGNITRIAPGQSGPYAIEMQTVLYPGNFVGQSGVTNGFYPPQGGPPKGGLPYTMTLDTLYGYYKFSGSNDSGIVYITLKKNGLNIGGTSKYLKSQANWTPFKLSISSGTIPDTMRVEIYSSQPGPGGPGAVGSTISLDNLSLYTQQPLGLMQLNNQSNYFVYPNPATDKLIIKSSASGISYKVYDVKGMELNIKEDLNQNGNIYLDISELQSGLYFISITGRSSFYNYKFIKK